MMNRNNRLFPLIKRFSIFLITSAIGLEVWHLYAGVMQHSIPALLHPVFWLERFALVAHFIEAAIAAAYASRQHQNRFSYAVYTFFVGTVGLVELFASDLDS